MVAICGRIKQLVCGIEGECPLSRVVQETFHFGMNHVFDLLFGLFAVPTNKALKRSTNPRLALRADLQGSHPLTREKLAHVSGSGSLREQT